MPKELNDEKFEDFKTKFYFFVNKLKNNEYFSWLSYGDGEFSFIFDKTSISNREIYYPNCRKELIETLYNCKSPGLYLSTIIEGVGGKDYPNLIKQAKKLIEKIGIQKRHDARLFYELLRWTSLGDIRYPPLTREFIETLRKKELVLIGGRYLKVLKEKGLFKEFKLIEIPTLGAYLENDRVENEILRYGKPAVYCFTAGITSNIIISNLHNKLKKSFLLDMGAFWDFLLGIGPRAVSQWRYPMLKNILKLEFYVE